MVPRPSLRSLKRPVSRGGDVLAELAEVPAPAATPPTTVLAATLLSKLPRAPSADTPGLNEAVLIDGIGSTLDAAISEYEGLDTTGTSLHQMQLGENRTPRPASQQRSRPVSRAGAQSGSSRARAAELAPQSANVPSTPELELPVVPTGVFMPSRGESSPFKVRSATADLGATWASDSLDSSQGPVGITKKGDASPVRRESTVQRRGSVRSSPDRKPVLSARSTSRNNLKLLMSGNVEVNLRRCM